MQDEKDGGEAYHQRSPFLWVSSHTAPAHKSYFSLSFEHGHPGICMHVLNEGALAAAHQARHLVGITCRDNGREDEAFNAVSFEASDLRCTTRTASALALYVGKP